MFGERKKLETNTNSNLHKNKN